MARERIQRRLAAILAADVVGYSRMMGADEARTLARLNEKLDTVIRPSIEVHHGRLVKSKGSFPSEELTEQQMFAQFDALEVAAQDFGVFGHAAHVNLKEGKAFCFMSGADEESIRKAHAAINLPYDSITEVRRVTGADMRIPQKADLSKRKEG